MLPDKKQNIARGLVSFAVCLTLAITSVFACIGIIWPTYAAIPTTEWGTATFGEEGQAFYDNIIANYSSVGDMLNPIKINNKYEMAAFAELVNEEGLTFANKHISLEANIDLGEHLWVPIGTDYTTNYYFAGTFNGRGNTIANMTINTNVTCVGLFGVMRGNSTIENLALNGGMINSNNPAAHVGGFAGIAVGTGITRIQNCINNMSVIQGDARRVGGILGSSANTSTLGTTTTFLNNCVNISLISTTMNMTLDTLDKVIGGIVSYIYQNGTVTNCANYGNIIVSASGISREVFVGGIVGYTYWPGHIFENCVSASQKIEVTSTRTLYFGGILGCAYEGLTMSNCLVTSELIAKGTSTNYVSGLVGYMSGFAHKRTVLNCAMLSPKITTGSGANYVGYLAAAIVHANTIIEDNYALNDADITPVSGPAGKDNTDFPVNTDYSLDDFLNDDPYGPGESIFRDELGWDFDDIWEKKEGELPNLKGHVIISDVIDQLRAMITIIINDMQAKYTIVTTLISNELRIAYEDALNAALNIEVSASVEDLQAILANLLVILAQLNQADPSNPGGGDPGTNPNPDSSFIEKWWPLIAGGAIALFGIMLAIIIGGRKKRSA